MHALYNMTIFSYEFILYMLSQSFPIDALWVFTLAIFVLQMSEQVGMHHSSPAIVFASM